MPSWQISRSMFLECDEVAGLLQHLAKQPGDDPGAFVDRLVVELLLFSGLRTSELCRLPLAAWRCPRLCGVGARRSPRDVFLPRRIADQLDTYIADVRPALLRSGRRSELLLNERGRGYERSGLYRRVVRVLAAAGLGERASVQLLRHTYGYLAYRYSGGNLLFVQRQLGHAHPIITSVYAQFVEEDYAAIADAVAGVAPDTKGAGDGRSRKRGARGGARNPGRRRVRTQRR